MLLCLKLRSAGQVKSEIDQIAAKLVQETVHALTGGEMGVHIDRNKFRCVDRLIYRGSRLTNCATIFIFTCGLREKHAFNLNLRFFLSLLIASRNIACRGAGNKKRVNLSFCSPPHAPRHAPQNKMSFCLLRLNKSRKPSAASP